MLKFIIRRLSLAVLVLFVVASITFFGLHLRGDPVAEALSQTGAPQSEIDRVKKELGHDRPLPVQYVSFLGDTVTGEFGSSIFYGQKSADLIMERMPYTVMLALAAVTITILISFPLGIASCIWRDTWVDRACGAFAAIGQSVPSFVVGPLLILVFAVSLGWLPVSGADSHAGVILPALTLSLYPLSRISRLLRGCMLSVANTDYVLNARARGLSEASVVMRYIFRNALLPVMTVLGMQIGHLLGGAIIVETIYAWPGIGLLMREALVNSDFSLAQSTVIFIAAIVLTVTLATDLLYSVADPRIRVE
jgi:peptide/nickel transport system permease protein